MYPSILNTFNRPTATDRLNSPSHSALHNTVSSAVGQIESFIGKEGASSTVGTLLYDVRSPDSNGGGHVQTANKGGTGQTTYTKGDLLVATSASVLSKLTVGADTYIPQADSSQASGIKWTQPASVRGLAGTIVAVNTSSVNGSATPSIFTLFSASIAGSILGSSNAIKFEGSIKKLVLGATNTVNIVVLYGGSRIAEINTSAPGAVSSTLSGTISGTIASRGNISSQLGFVKINLSNPVAGVGNVLGPIVMGFSQLEESNANSDALQSLVITNQFGGTPENASIVTGLFVVEKIV